MPNAVSRTIVTNNLTSSFQSICGYWPSNVMRQDATHLYGLRNITGDDWVVDVLAKP